MTTIQVRATDHDLSECYGQLKAAVRGVLVEASRTAQRLAGANRELSAAVEHLSSSTQEQASALEETVALLEHVTTAVKHNTDKAQQASDLAVGSLGRAANEQGSITAVGAMREISTSSRRIADIIAVIDEIAFQTNLLALNAAVEAARAGEQGRGFAVVAAEVRNLAGRSAQAAKEIRMLIQDAVRKVESGTHCVQQVADFIAEIAAASHEQRQGIEQGRQAITQIDQVTQANAAQTEELSATAQSLTAQAQQLQALVEQFKLSHDGVAPADGAAPLAIAVPTVKPLRAQSGQEQETHLRQPALPPGKEPVPVAVAATSEAAAFEEF